MSGNMSGGTAKSLLSVVGTIFLHGGTADPMT